MRKIRDGLEGGLRRVTTALEGGRRRVNTAFEGGRRRVNTVGTMVFRVQKCQWAEKYVTFYRLHVAYILSLSCFGTFILWVIPLTNSKRLSLISALYTSVSLVASTGLQTVESASFTYTHYSIMVFLMILGSPLTTSLLPLLVRRYYFHLCIKQYAFERSQQLQKLDLSMSFHLIFSTTSRENEMKVHHDKGAKVGILEEPDGQPPPKCCQNSELESHHQLQLEQERKESLRVFVDAQQALRTLEYRALVALSWLIIRFMFAVSIMGFILVAVYFLSFGGHDRRMLEKRGINPYFYAMFSSLSAFSNTGYSMTNDNMIPFIRSSAFLFLYAVLASVGNTLYGPVLRFLVWVCYKRAPDKDKSVYDYLLKHPRRCHTYLFPRYQTLWLVGVFFVMTGFQLFFMCLLEWRSAFDGLTTIEKVVASFYQAVSSRNAGGLAVNLTELAPALLFIIVAFMYMSVYPGFLARQTTQEGDSESRYDEAILGIYKDKAAGPNTPDETILVKESRMLLARDTTFLFVALFILCLSESKNIKMDPLNYSIFNIVFEVTSAFGNIGLSMGYDCGLRLDQETKCNAIAYSFSGAWSLVGRLTIIVVMLLGRHRGLADNIDSAIRLPTKIVPYTTPSTPRPSNVSNSPHQLSIPLTHRKSGPSPSPTPNIRRLAALDISALSLYLPAGMSNPCSVPPTPTFPYPPPPPLLLLPPPSPMAAASTTETPDVPTSGPAPAATVPLSSPSPYEFKTSPPDLPISAGNSPLSSVTTSEPVTETVTLEETITVTPFTANVPPVCAPSGRKDSESMEAPETPVLPSTATLCSAQEVKARGGESQVKVPESITASNL